MLGRATSILINGSAHQLGGSQEARPVKRPRRCQILKSIQILRWELLTLEALSNLQTVYSKKEEVYVQTVSSDPFVSSHWTLVKKRLFYGLACSSPTTRSALAENQLKIKAGLAYDLINFENRFSQHSSATSSLRKSPVHFVVLSW